MKCSNMNVTNRPEFHVSQFGLMVVFIFLTFATRSFGDDDELKRGVGNQPFLAPESNLSGFEWRLQNALYLGKFHAESVDEALKTAFIDEGKIEPKEHDRTEAHEWMLGHNGEIWRASALDLKDGGKFFAIYFSYWVYTPRAVTADDSLRVACLVCTKVKLFVNGKALEAGELKTGSDFRTFYPYRNVELKRGWNHILVKLAGGAEEIPDVQQKASLCVYMKALDPDQFTKFVSAISVLSASDQLGN